MGVPSYDKLLDDKDAVKNFKGQTLRELLRDHGSGVKCLIRKGEMHVVLPTHKDASCSFKAHVPSQEKYGKLDPV